MALFARSDLAYLNVPAEIGGCGLPHSRPVEQGAPAKVWDLGCPPCEDVKRRQNDPHWSATPEDVPLTFDQERAREKAEKSGKLDRENQLAAAIIELGKLGSLPEALGRILAPALGAAQVPSTLAGQMVCPSGHGNPPGQKFCGDCGQPMSQPAARAAITAPPAPSGRPRRLRDARLDELQALARNRLLDADGTRADLITRLAAAGVTSNDLAALSLVPA